MRVSPCMLPAVALVLAACASSAPVTRELSFTDGDARTYAARLTIPARNSRGVGVLLIGGGNITDMHWTVPAFVEDNGQMVRLTIDGRETRDADTIAASLVRAGFVVMQWSSIHSDDEVRRSNPVLATPIPYARSVDLTQRALALLRSRPEVDANRIALVGHSLGGTRAWQVADDGVIAIVTLAGAYTSRVRESPAKLAANAWQVAAPADTDADGLLSPAEFDAWDPRAVADDFAAIDTDSDGCIRGWELAASTLLARLDAGDPSTLDATAELRDGLAWPSDRAADLRIPWLAIYGGLDDLSVHAPLVERWIRIQNIGGTTVEVRPWLGHQLGPVEGTLTGPIDPGVVERLAEWLSNRARVTLSCPSCCRSAP